MKKKLKNLPSKFIQKIEGTMSLKSFFDLSRYQLVVKI